jgi:hypothetical protein
MKSNQEHAYLSIKLFPGKFVLYALVEPTRMNGFYPDSSVINIYSSHRVDFDPITSSRCSNALRDAFLADGLKYEKRMIENKGLMSLAYRLLFQQGGFAYIVFHNDKSSDKCFVVNYDEE